MKTVASYALGCKVNQYESEAIGELFAHAGYKIVAISEPADIYIINTCTVTNLGDKKSRQLIRRVKKQSPTSIVAVIGCYAQTAPEEILRIEGVNIIIGTKDRKSILSTIEAYDPSQGVMNRVSSIAAEHAFEPLSISGLQNRTRAYLKIQDGCDRYCSYCIIPYARGPIRSRAPKEVVQEVQTLCENGFLEIVLTGIHVASYGRDLKTTNLLDILQKIHPTAGLQRIRLSSLEPGIITEEFLEGLSYLESFCPHFHLSLQSGCEKTLRKMNRKYTPQSYEHAAALIRQYFPTAALTTDIIAGFPQESAEDFTESYEFAKKIGFLKIHAFPYSPKTGTPAAKMDGQIPNAVKNERCQQLIALSGETGLAFMHQFENSRMDVLFETQDIHGVAEGYTKNYMKVHVPTGGENLTNQIVSVHLKKALPLHMEGEL